MKAIVSGDAAAVAIVANEVEFRSVGGKRVENCNIFDVSRAFDGCHDIRVVEVKDRREADERAELAWAEDRALRFFLFLVDPDEEAQNLIEYAECLEELLGYPETSNHIKRRLLSNPIPVLIEINQIHQAVSQCPKASALFNHIFSLQDSITRVAQAFKLVVEDAFGGGYKKQMCRELLIRDGTMRELVETTDEGKSIDFLRLAIMSRHRPYGPALQQFLDYLQPQTQKLPRSILQENEADDLDQEDHEGARDGDHETFAMVRAQQKGIIEKLRQHDFAAARKYAVQLIGEQHRRSKREHIAKSLCLLAQQAKQYEATELQEEWAAQANEINPSDPMTSGHLADALICKGDYVAAYKAIDQTESRGDALFAQTSRARIRRHEGRYQEAYELYLDATQRFSQQEDVVYAWTGVAETLRDMGKYSIALRNYEYITRRWHDNG